MVRETRGVCAAVTMALCAASLPAQGRDGRDVQALIEDLEMPRTGSFAFTVNVRGSLLKDEPATEEAQQEAQQPPPQ